MRQGRAVLVAMSQGQFVNHKTLIEYAHTYDLAYVWEGSHEFAKRWRLAQLAQPGLYEVVEVVTSRKIIKALLFPKAILRAEAEADRPPRKALPFKRERLRARKAAKKRPT
jgi:hypothetical protein